MWTISLSDLELVLLTLLFLLPYATTIILWKGILKMSASDNLNAAVSNLDAVANSLVSAISSIPANNDAVIQAAADKVNAIAVSLQSEVAKLAPSA